VVRATRIGVDALPACGTNDEVLAHHGLDVAGLVARLETACALLLFKSAGTEDTVRR